MNRLNSSRYGSPRSLWLLAMTVFRGAHKYVSYAGIFIFFPLIPYTYANNQNIRLSPINIPVSSPKKMSSNLEFSPQDINNKQLTNLPDVLGRVPSMHISKVGGSGQPISISYKGFRTHQIICSKDNVFLNDQGSFNGPAHLNNQFLDSTQSIKFVRSPQALLYGSGAMGGALLVKNNLDNTDAYLMQEVGLPGYTHPSLTLRHKKERFAYYLNGAYIKDAGYNSVPQYLKTARCLNPSNEYKNHNLSFVGKIRASDNTSLALSVHQKKASFDYFDLYALHNWQGIDKEGHYSAHLKINTPQNSKHKITISKSEFLRLDQNNIVESNKFHRTNQQYRLFWDWKVPLEYADKSHFSFNCQKLSVQKHKPSSKTHQDYNYGAAFYQKITLPKDITLSYSGRSDWSNKTPTKLSYSIEASAPLFHKNFQILGKHAHIYRMPTLEERFSQYNSFHGNPLLKPELAHIYELGVIIQKQPTSFFKIELGFNGFYTQIDDMVIRSRTTLDNSPKSFFKGLETFIGMEYENYKVGLNYTFINAHQIKENANKKVVSHPRHISTLSLSYTKENWSLEGRANIIGNMHDIHPTNFNIITPTSAYATCGIHGYYKIRDECMLFFKAENIFNRMYESPKGYLGKGISLLTGIRIKCF